MNASGHEDFDTAWLAYRYVSGELAGAELARFEERLAEDQSARETVAEVVDLCVAIEALPRSTFSPAPAGARTWPVAVLPAVGWMAVGAAACLALVFGLQSTLRGPGSQHVAQSNDTDAAGDRRLALSWTQQSSAHEGTSSAVDGSTAETSSAAEGSDSMSDMESGESESSEPENSETRDADSLEPPGWVTAAIDESAKPAAPANTKTEETP